MFLTGAIGAMTLTGCTDESPWRGSDSAGGISLNLSADGRVMRQTRADDSQVSFVPEASDFSVTLKAKEGSYSRTWSSVEGFNREESFPMGDYRISAEYGDPEVEGFELPCFRGSADVHVSPGAESDVSIVATLANAMVSIRYTDAFKENFPAFSAAVQSEGHDRVVFAGDEERPAYICPSEIRLDLTLTNLNGDRVTIEPASFTALARHHYVVTVGVEGNAASGDLSLDVVFDEDVVAETVEVPLGDELFTAPAPVVKANGFTAGDRIEGFEHIVPKSEIEFHSFAFGGLRSATLDIISANGYTPSFGRSVELVNAPADVQRKLEAEGVDAAGFFRNVDKMGVVNLTQFIGKLPAGEYDIELHLVDAMTRTSEPVRLSLALAPVQFDFVEPGVVDFLATEIPVDITTNCSEIRDNMRFMAPDAGNRMVDAPIKSVTTVSDQGGNFVYRYVIEVAPVSKSPVDVCAILGDLRKEVKVPVDMPEFTLEADAFAHKLLLKIEGPDEERIRKIRNNLVFYNGTTTVPTANIVHDADGIITISGLKAATTYNSLRAMYETLEIPIPAFTTEAETDLPNGNFNSVTETINLQKVQVGGLWRVSPVDYRNTSSIVRSTADGWGDINSITCDPMSNPINTWFVVPSTYVENGEAVIRSVGYNHNGTVPARSGGAFNTKYYCENAPTDAQLEKAAGRMFAGTSAGQGISFASRPATLSFRYRYAPLDGESAQAEIKVYDAAGSVIATGSAVLAAASDMTAVTVPVTGYSFGRKAARVSVEFRSTEDGKTPAINIPKGSALKEDNGGNLLNLRELPANTYHAVATGSVLTIDDVSLGYGGGAEMRSNKRRIRK